MREDGRDSGSAIAFRLGAQLDRLRRVGHYDLAFKLEANQWNGTVAPQLNVREVFDADERYVERREWLKAEWRKQARDPDGRARSSPSSASPRAARGGTCWSPSDSSRCWPSPSSRERPSGRTIRA